MYSSGHVGISLVVFAPILFVLVATQAYTMAILGLFGVLLLASIPDADMKFQYESTVFHKIPLLRRLVPDIKHRGITHSIWFMVFIGVFFGVSGFTLYPLVEAIVSPSRLVFSLGLLFIGFIGVFSHLLGDYITPTGINISHPWGESKVFTVHSSNTFLFSFRSRSDVRGDLRKNGVLTVASNSVANYVANLIGILCVGLSIVFAFSPLIVGFSAIVSGIVFVCVYSVLVLTPVIISQRSEVYRYFL